MTERCLQRGKTSGRVDDNPESLVKRFKTHMETSMPVINLFDEKGMVKRINANRTREEVAADAIAILKDL
jgi:UMP-CMP kinase